MMSEVNRIADVSWNIYKKMIDDASSSKWLYWYTSTTLNIIRNNVWNKIQFATIVYFIINIPLKRKIKNKLSRFNDALK